jgi:hypothetical protein
MTLKEFRELTKDIDEECILTANGKVIIIDVITSSQIIYLAPDVQTNGARREKELNLRLR